MLRLMSSALYVQFPLLLLIAACSAIVGCTNDQSGEDAHEIVFPKDVSNWPEGRSCMFSHEHELRYIRVVTDSTAEIPYHKLNAEQPYPVGATLVKIEYRDPGCTEVLGYTAMKKHEPGYSPQGNDWLWQKVNVDFDVVEAGPGLDSCIDCHKHHCTWPECGYSDCGFDLTCGIEK